MKYMQLPVAVVILLSLALPDIATISGDEPTVGSLFAQRKGGGVSQARPRRTYPSNLRTTRKKPQTKKHAPHSSLSPGGGLKHHEYGKFDGHTIRNHVGKSESDLRKRLELEPTIRRASSFHDRATAEDAVSQVLDKKAAHVSKWLAGSKEREDFWLHLDKPVGISLEKGADGAKTVSGVRVRLRRDSSSELGYAIVTAFPEP